MDSDLLNEYIGNIRSIFEAIDDRCRQRLYDMVHKERIDWGYMCYVKDDERYSAAYYVMCLGDILLKRGFISYEAWKKEMSSLLSFLNSYPFACCMEKDMQTIIDGAWNSYWCGKTTWYRAWELLPIWKKWIINFTAIKIAYWSPFILELILGICNGLSYVILFSSLLPFIVAISKDKLPDYAYPLILILYNHIISVYELDHFISESSLFVVTRINEIIFYTCNILILICSIVLYINRHNSDSFKRADDIRSFRY